MQNHYFRYKAAGILLLFSLLIFTGCTKEKADITEETPAAEMLSETPVAELEATEPETAEPENIEPIITEADWEGYFDGINGVAVIYNPLENSYQIYNQELALTRRSPCSTFKIISSLIALENKIIVPEASTRTWSGEIFWNENWNKDIAFEEAFRTSCVWYYRKLIDEIGEDIMQEELDRLLYGNCDISDWEGRLNTNNNNRALTGFWIESSLKISPKEQVEVMERIFGEGSAYSQETQDYLKQVMLVKEQENTGISIDAGTDIYGKTGMGKAYGVTVDAWFTGFADIGKERVYFCVYLGETEGKDVSSTKAKEIAVELIQMNFKEVETRFDELYHTI